MYPLLHIVEAMVRKPGFEVGFVKEKGETSPSADFCNLIASSKAFRAL